MKGTFTLFVSTVLLSSVAIAQNFAQNDLTEADLFGGNTDQIIVVKPGGSVSQEKQRQRERTVLQERRQQQQRQDVIIRQSTPTPRPQVVVPAPKPKVDPNLVKDQKTGIVGAIIDDRGDSAAESARIARKRQKIKEINKEELPDAAPAERSSAFVKSQSWYGDSYYPDFGNRRRLTMDSWTYQRGSTDNALVLSCMYDINAGDRVGFELFITSNVAINRLGRPVDVKIETQNDDPFTIPGRVSDNYVGNVYVPITDDIQERVIRRMKEANWVVISIPTIGGVSHHKVEYSLRGFTKASLNTLTNCVND